MLSAAIEVLTSSLPGHASSARTSQWLLARVAPALLTGLRREERCLLSAGMILARARSGDSAGAVELADAEIDRAVVTHTDVPAASVSAFWAAASEAFVTAGWPRNGARFALEAEERADATGSDSARFRALALLTVSRALNGEYAAAASAAASARALERAHGWAASTATYPLLLGEILLASANLDTAALDSCAAQLREDPTGDVSWPATAAAATAMSLLVQGQTSEALTTIMTVTNGTDEPGVTEMIRGFSLGIHADLLLARGEPIRTLALLAGRKSPGGHALCFDMQRAAAHLQLGEYRSVITTTEACMRLGTEHCLRTIPPLLLRRAVAWDRLGREGVADRDFEDAFHLIVASGSSTPLLTVPRDDLVALLDRLGVRRPELGAKVSEVRARIVRVPAARAPERIMPLLTKREAELAHALRTGTPLRSIAASQHVSYNTVKSQSRSLYVKLAVTSRDEAVQVLEEAGFFD